MAGALDTSRSGTFGNVQAERARGEGNLDIRPTNFATREPGRIMDAVH